MSNQGFSPAPWKLRDSGAGYLVLRADGWGIANIFDRGAHPVHGGEVSTDERDCNARLIAAAPELLEALAGMYADQVDYLTLNNLGGMDNHWMKVARAAIAKAKGVQS